MELSHLYLGFLALGMPVLFWMSYKLLSNSPQHTDTQQPEPVTHCHHHLIELDLDHGSVNGLRAYDEIERVYQQLGQPDYRNPQSPEHLYYPSQGMEIALKDNRIDAFYIFVNPDLTILHAHQQHPFTSCPIQLRHQQNLIPLNPAIHHEQLQQLLNNQCKIHFNPNSNKKSLLFFSQTAYINKQFKQANPNSKGELHLRCEFDFDRFDRLLGIWISYIYA